jgi:hypothetical protein
MCGRSAALTLEVTVYHGVSGGLDDPRAKMRSIRVGRCRLGVARKRVAVCESCRR